MYLYMAIAIDRVYIYECYIVITILWQEETGEPGGGGFGEGGGTRVLICIYLYIIIIYYIHCVWRFLTRARSLSAGRHVRERTERQPFYCNIIINIVLLLGTPARVQNSAPTIPSKLVRRTTLYGIYRPPPRSS